jgi:transcriptional regulator with XRE-family HTH domain
MTLKEYVSKTGISIIQIAKESGISDRQIYRIMSGVSDPKLSTLEKISKVTGIAVDKIVTKTAA